MAGCEDGEQLAVTGTVSQIYENKAGGWNLVLSQLNKELIACDVEFLMGSKTPRPTFVLVVSRKPPPQCRVGSRVQATIELSEGVLSGDLGLEYKTIRSQCG